MARAEKNTLLHRGGLSPATALLVGDNSSERAPGAAWVGALDPRLALISVGTRYGPAQPIITTSRSKKISRQLCSHPPIHMMICPKNRTPSHSGVMHRFIYCPNVDVR
jgi:hypothetical protein